MGSMQRLTLPTVYCIVLNASSDIAGNLLNSVLSALHHSLTPLWSLHRPIWERPGSCLVYHTLVLPKRHELRFLRNSLASPFNALTRSQFVKLNTLW